MKKVIAVLGLLVTTNTMADEGWVRVGDGVWIQKESVVVAPKVVGAVIRINTKRVGFHRLLVGAEVCAKGYGHVFLTDISYGDADKIDYVKGGGTVAATIADILCGVKEEVDREGGM